MPFFQNMSQDLLFIELKSLVQNFEITLHQSITVSKCSSDTTAQNTMHLLHYSWSIILWKTLNNIMKVKQLRTKYVQVWSVSRCLLLGEKENTPYSIWLLSVCVFPTVNVFLEGHRAGSWWKPLMFFGWDRPRDGGEFESPAVPDHPPLNVILRGPHSKISAMGPE